MRRKRAPEFFCRRRFVLRGWLRAQHPKWQVLPNVRTENTPIFHLQWGRKMAMVRRVTAPAASVVMLHKWRDTVIRHNLPQRKMLLLPVQYGARYGVSQCVLLPLWERLGYRPLGARG